MKIPKDTYDYESQSQPTRTVTLAERLRDLEKKVNLEEKREDTKEKTKVFKWPFKWRKKFTKAKKKSMADMLLVIFLNKKNEIEVPKFMPIYEGNMVIWRNKPYEFDPRAIWTIRGMKGNPKAYLIKEIDRRPVRNKFGKAVYTDAAVSNLDLEEIRQRGDSTESDEFLIKAALKAQQSQNKKKQVSMAIILVIGLIVLGGLAYFLFGGGSGA